MKEDPIKHLIKASGVETSTDFTQKTIEKMEQRIQGKIKLRIYLLIVVVTLLFMVVGWALVRTGFTVALFGVLVGLPKVITIVLISLLAFLTHSHLLRLLGASALGDR